LPIKGSPEPTQGKAFLAIPYDFRHTQEHKVSTANLDAQKVVAKWYQNFGALIPRSEKIFSLKKIFPLPE
jgi:hypothetical protein